MTSASSLARSTFAPIAALALCSSALATGSGTSLDAYARTVTTGVEINVDLYTSEIGTFTLFASPMTDGAFDASSARRIARGQLDPSGTTDIFSHVCDPAVFPESFGISLRAVLVTSAGVVQLPDVGLPLTGMVGSQVLDFDWTIGPDEPEKGEIITDQYALAGVRISALNASATGPDLAIIFDSQDISGADDDLRTPGSGVGNTTALGKLLICAEDAQDSNGDGRIDDPDDEGDGSTLRFDFADAVTMSSITLVDIDDAGQSELRFSIEGGSVETIPVVDLGDNSVQNITFMKQNVTRLDVVLAGSGAIAELQLIPCPLLINLDETPFGRPRDFAAGLEITDQFQDLGLTVSGINGNPASNHPDKVILFDSENPTGDDFDLMTPGPGVNNDNPLGFVLIIAENDLDSNGDGLVDDPDDEGLGGRMIFEFDNDVTFRGATVLDVDGSEFDVFEFYDSSGLLIETIQINALGDNSVQTLTNDPPITGVRRIELNLIGSGAVTRLRWCPESSTPGA